MVEDLQWQNRRRFEAFSQLRQLRGSNEYRNGAAREGEGHYLSRVDLLLCPPLQIEILPQTTRHSKYILKITRRTPMVLKKVQIINTERKSNQIVL